MHTLLISSFLSAILMSPAELERLLVEHGWGSPQRGERLNAVAASLAETIGRSTEPIGPKAIAEHLRFLLSSAEVTDSQVVPFSIQHTSSGGLRTHLPLLLGRLERRFPPTHYGMATFGTGRQLTSTIVLVHRGIELAKPLPNQAIVYTRFTVTGPLRSGYFKPRIIIDPPGAQGIRDRPAWNHKREIDVNLFFDAGKGIYDVELVAESQYGPVVLHQQKIHVGVRPPMLPMIRLGRTRPNTGKTLADSIDTFRRANGLAPLQWSARLSAIATNYAHEMSRHGRVAHGSPDTGTLTTRLRAQGVVFGEIGENLAEAANGTDAFRGFIDSPGHKRNLLLPHVTHIGVGVKGRFFAIFLVQLLEKEAKKSVEKTDEK